jgi:uncharacterized damage-inducible protein DinB
MTTRPRKPRPKASTPLAQVAVQIFAANERTNQLLIEHLDPTAWKAKPPGKTRTIVAIFTHMHNVRTKWIRLTAPHLKVPLQLHRARCTQPQARAALAESAARCIEMLAEALGSSGSRIKMFRRDALAPAWPVGLEMLCYMLAHEAHHRGQVCMLARQMGFPLPYKASDGIWNWEKLWRESGSPRGPGCKLTYCSRAQASNSPTHLFPASRIHPVQRPRKRNRLPHMIQPAHPRHHALNPHAEP